LSLGGLSSRTPDFGPDIHEGGRGRLSQRSISTGINVPIEGGFVGVVLVDQSSVSADFRVSGLPQQPRQSNPASPYVWTRVCAGDRSRGHQADPDVIVRLQLPTRVHDGTTVPLHHVVEYMNRTRPWFEDVIRHRRDNLVPYQK